MDIPGRDEMNVQAGRRGFSPRRRLVIPVKTNVNELQIGTAFDMSAVPYEVGGHENNMRCCICAMPRIIYLMTQEDTRIRQSRFG